MAERKNDCPVHTDEEAETYGCSWGVCSECGWEGELIEHVGGAEDVLLPEVDDD